jgi:hypothetical protein
MDGDEAVAVVNRCFKFKKARSAAVDHVNGTLGEVRRRERGEAGVL